tara:strand:+ start:231 stop:908 length:678 start_codon:yes stop_codon:yes gene_type:complete
MKKIILFISIILLSFNSYSQKEEGNVWREAAKFLYDKGFDRDELRNTIELVREMSNEIFENEKLSKKTEKKLKKLSFSDEQLEILKSLSQKMSKMVDAKEKKKDNEINSFDNNNQDRINRGRGGQRGGQRAGTPNDRNGPPRPEVNNPVIQRLAEFVREQGVSRENMRNVMSIIMQIGREYKSSTERSSFKPSEENLSKLKDAGLSDETLEAVIDVIKALAIYDK